MERSAGIIPYKISDDGKVLFFVGHPGGPFWNGKEYYAFMKGHIEDGETEFDAALREFKEETGINLPINGDYNFLGCVRQNSKKTVCAFSIEFDLDETNCKSNTCEVEIPTNDGKKIIEVSEIDDYKWMDYDHLKKVTNFKHLLFYEKIINLVNDRNS